MRRAKHLTGGGNIYRINRITPRLMEIIFKTGNHIRNLSILYTYAPRMQYDEEEIEEYWAAVQEYIDKIPHNLIKMRRIDTNGQIAQWENINAVGKWTTPNKTEQRNGEKSVKKMEGGETICPNRYFAQLKIIQRISRHGACKTG